MRQFLNLIGDGTCEDPDIIVRWNGYEFGHVLAGRDDPVRRSVAVEQGVWPIIDYMLLRIYGELTEEERLDWYELHRDDTVSITAPPHPKPRDCTVFSWSDKLRFRPAVERLETEVIPELKRIYGARSRSGRSEDVHH